MAKNWFSMAHGNLETLYLALQARTSLSPQPEMQGHTGHKVLMSCVPGPGQELQPELAAVGTNATDGATSYGTQGISPAQSPDLHIPYQSDILRSTSPGGCNWRSLSASHWGRCVSAARCCAGQTHSLGMERVVILWSAQPHALPAQPPISLPAILQPFPPHTYSPLSPLQVAQVSCLTF